MANMNQLRGIVTLIALAAGLSGCGGGQDKPAESPEPAMPEAPAGGDTPAEGGSGEQHTMPDGTTMPGEQHGDHGEGSSPAPAEDAPKEK